MDGWSRESVAGEVMMVVNSLIACDPVVAGEDRLEVVRGTW